MNAALDAYIHGLDSFETSEPQAGDPDDPRNAPACICTPTCAASPATCETCPYCCAEYAKSHPETPICECGPVRWQSGPRYGQHADTCPAK